MAKSKELRDKVKELEAKLAEQEKKESELDESREELQKLADEVFKETEPDDGDVASVIEKVIYAENDEEDEIQGDDIDPTLRSTLAKFVKDGIEKGKKKGTSMGLPEAPDDDEGVDELPKESAVSALRRITAEKKARKKTEPKPETQASKLEKKVKEQKAKSKSELKAEPKAEKPTGAVVKGSEKKSEPKQKTEAKPAKKAEPKAKTEAKPDPKPAKKAEPAPEPQPEIHEEAVKHTSTSCHPDGPGKAYKYWHYKTRTWNFAADYWAATQNSDIWKVVWVWYKDGVIDHILTNEEIKEFLP